MYRTGNCHHQVRLPGFRSRLRKPNSLSSGSDTPVSLFGAIAVNIQSTLQHKNVSRCTSIDGATSLLRFSQLPFGRQLPARRRRQRFE